MKIIGSEKMEGAEELVILNVERFRGQVIATIGDEVCKGGLLDEIGRAHV